MPRSRRLQTPKPPPAPCPECSVPAQGTEQAVAGNQSLAQVGSLPQPFGQSLRHLGRLGTLGSRARV